MEGHPAQGRTLARHGSFAMWQPTQSTLECADLWRPIARETLHGSEPQISRGDGATLFKPQSDMHSRVQWFHKTCTLLSPVVSQSNLRIREPWVAWLDSTTPNGLRSRTRISWKPLINSMQTHSSIQCKPSMRLTGFQLQA